MAEEHYKKRSSNEAKEMNTENYRMIRVWVAACMMLFAGVRARAQAMEEADAIPEEPMPSASSIEALNYLGGDTSMPLFSDSAIDVNSKFRQDMLSKGMALRLIALGSVRAEHAGCAGRSR
jgi:hypothetical protein